MLNEEMTSHNEIKLFQFYAHWCQPCQMMMPIVAAIHEKQGDWLIVRQIDVDQSPAIANQYHIRSIPTFVLLRNNQEVWRKTGVLSENSLTEVLLSFKG